MGSCQSGCTIFNESEQQITSRDVVPKDAYLSNSEIQASALKIGENGFECPLTRHALLREDYSHIYDTSFKESKEKQIALVQNRIRAYVLRRRFINIQKQRK